MNFRVDHSDRVDLSTFFEKTYKEPTVAPLKSLESTNSTKLLHLLMTETNLTISLAFNTFSLFRCIRNP